jgi:ectoine hydroxylase-related dioxygenase (phytanoyl-CoA dioxygenase family)
MNKFDQHVMELKVYGYTIVEEVLTLQEVKAMREFVVDQEDRIGVVTHHRGIARHLANLINLDPMFFSVIDHPGVLPLIEAIMGEHLILGSLNARVVRPGDGEQTLHSDIPLPLHRYGTDSPVMMNTVWPLHDYTNENGATRLVPGSHQSHLQEPPEGFDVKHEMQAVVPAGSVVIINGQTWHAGGANGTTSKRAAMFGHYRFGEWMRFQCDPHDQFPEQWWEVLTLRQKQLLRMTQGVTGQHGADFYER